MSSAPFPSAPGARRAPFRELARWRLPPIGTRTAWAATVALVVITLAATVHVQRRAERARQQWGGTAPVWVVAGSRPAGHALTGADVRAARVPIAVLPSGAVPAEHDPVGETLGADVVAGEVLVTARLAGVLTVLELDPTSAMLPGGPPPPPGRPIVLLLADAGAVIDATMAAPAGDGMPGGGPWRVAVPQRDAAQVAAGLARGTLVVGLVSVPTPPTG